MPGERGCVVYHHPPGLAVYEWRSCNHIIPTKLSLTHGGAHHHHHHQRRRRQHPTATHPPPSFNTTHSVYTPPHPPAISTPTQPPHACQGIDDRHVLQRVRCPSARVAVFSEYPAPCARARRVAMHKNSTLTRSTRVRIVQLALLALYSIVVVLGIAWLHLEQTIRIWATSVFGLSLLRRCRPFPRSHHIHVI